VCSSVKLTA